MQKLIINPVRAATSLSINPFIALLLLLYPTLALALETFLYSFLGSLNVFSGGYYLLCPPTPPKPQPTLVVIDGLDECKDPAVQCDILTTIADAIPALPSSFRFLIASRPEAHLTRVFDYHTSFKQLNVRRVNLDEDQEVEEQEPEDGGGWKQRSGLGDRERWLESAELVAVRSTSSHSTSLRTVRNRD